MKSRLYAVFKCVISCLNNLIYKSKPNAYRLRCLAYICWVSLNVNTSMKDCVTIRIKEDHNAENYRLTTFGFEIEIMDKYVFVVNSRGSGADCTFLCCFCTDAHGLHTYCRWSMCEKGGMNAHHWSQSDVSGLCFVVSCNYHKRALYAIHLFVGLGLLGKCFKETSNSFFCCFAC